MDKIILNNSVVGKEVLLLTGADLLIDGGATASYFYGPLRPEEK